MEQRERTVLERGNDGGYARSRRRSRRAPRRCSITRADQQRGFRPAIGWHGHPHRQVTSAYESCLQGGRARAMVRTGRRADHPARAECHPAGAGRNSPCLDLELHPPVAPAPTVEELGPVLREFHSLGPLPERLPAWDPVGDARSRLADAEELSDSDRQFLLDWCDRLEAPVAALQQRAGSGIIHGDAHVSNLLRNAAGRVVLCDFDATCLGPWQVDLVAVAVGEVRFGQRGAHATLAEAYGYDVTTDPDWPLLRDARELKMIAAAVPRLRSSAGVRAEFAARLHSVRENHQHARWKPFAEIGG